jgi:hypothetical protein
MLPLGVLPMLVCDGHDRGLEGEKQPRNRFGRIVGGDPGESAIEMLAGELVFWRVGTQRDRTGRLGGLG